MELNWPVIKVICKRDLRIYFNSPTGYLFITVFIFLSAAAAFWQERFFGNNLANLDQLNVYLPYLLLLFIPAVTMSIWAEERRQGTDELLLTLPATDIEIVLGKYLAVLGIYTASLILSLSHVIVLFWLGSPDLGLMVANYLGYWLIGASLLAVGMLASLLTANATIGYILGVLFCAVFVFIGSLQWLTGEWVGRLFDRLTVFGYFSDFSKGIISLSGIAYFLSVAAAMLYLNVILLGRRLWPAEAGGYKMWVHYTLRTVSLIIGCFSLVALLTFMPFRLDATAESLYSLSDQTEDLVSSLPEGKKVLIQAYISPQAPAGYVETRANLVNTLEEIAAVSAGDVQVMIYDTEPYSAEARDARDKFNIVSREIVVSGSAHSAKEQLFMGVAFTCGAQEMVIPFFDRGLPVEYELVRSLRAVAQSNRKKIGILQTGAKLFGDFDYQSGRRVPPWRIVSELEKQYDVAMISAEQPIADTINALVAVLPSSLSQAEMDNLQAYILAGHPTLLMDDPMPIFDISQSPILPRDAQTNMFQQQQQETPPKGSIDKLMSAIGVKWNPALVVWDSYNPHPDLAVIQQEVVFIGEGNKNQQAFNQSSPITSGLQEVVLMFAGYLDLPPSPNMVFDPLLQTGVVSGVNHWYGLVQRGFFGLSLNPRPPRSPSPDMYTLAARITGCPDTTGTKDPATGLSAGEKNVNLVVIADIDIVSEEFFVIRERGVGQYNFDNITFVLNCIDYLAGDESFIDLRKRRVKHRTLTAVETRTEDFISRRLAEEKEAEQVARQALNDAQQRLNEKVAEVRNRADLDEQTKQIMANNLQQAENKRFEASRAVIEAERDSKIARSHENTEMAIRSIQTRIKTLAVLLPPVPVFVMGVVIFIKRRRREHEGTVAARRLRG